MAAALVLLLLVLAPGVAAGQTAAAPATPSTPGTPPELNPRTPPPPTIPSAPEIVFPVVPPAARPVQLFEFHPLVGVSEEYSDNFNRSVHNRQENFRSTVAPGMSVLMDTGLLTGQATYSIAGFHDSSLDEPGYFNTALGRLAWQATPRLKLTAAGGVNESDSPFQADRLGVQQERRRFTSTNASAGADYTLADITTSPSYRLTRFSQDGGADTTSHALGASASTAVVRIHTVTLGYEYLTSETSQGIGSAGVIGRSTEIRGHQATASLTRELSARATVGVSGAYNTRTQEESNPTTRSDFGTRSGSLFGTYAIPSTIVLRVSLGVSQLATDTAEGDPQVSTASALSYWFGDAVASVAVERGFSETFAGGQNAGVVETTGYTGSLSYPLTPSLKGAGSISYRENTFTGVGVASPGTRTDEVLTGSAALTLQIRRWLGTSLEYVYSTTSSTDSTRDISENRVRLSLSLSF